ncbi:hypothetical protein HPP92_009868 [Vanilla planifolia]|uniref:acyl-[acyl-carrier-protein] 4-desaturase n=1 Tax=Vanilla planifolia TaxID=51239 RepID=A0A835R425_VANPL|nr:hypothetical protein HPP92_009868 [Vanilla planifolia]
MAFRFFNMAYYSWKTSPSPSLSPSPSPSLLALAAAGRFRAAKVSVATNDPLSVEKKMGAEKKVLCFRPARQVQEQVTHSMEPEKMVEMFKTLEEWAEKELLGFLKPVEKSWQPQDLLPDPSSEEFFVQVKELRQRAEEIPDEYFVCLVGEHDNRGSASHLPNLSQYVGWRGR